MTGLGGLVVKVTLIEREREKEREREREGEREIQHTAKLMTRPAV